MCYDTDFYVNGSFNLRILSLDLTIKSTLCPSVNNSCPETKSVPILVFELRILLSVCYVLYFVAGVFYGTKRRALSSVCSVLNPHTTVSANSAFSVMFNTAEVFSSQCIMSFE